MKKHILLFLASLLFVLPLACDDPDNCGDPGIIDLTMEDNGEIIWMKRSDAIRVNLLTHGSEGYTWVNQQVEDTNIVQIGDPVADCPSFAPPGGSCPLTYMFQAVDSGIGAIDLKCIRTWAPEQEPLETFYVKVIVIG